MLQQEREIQQRKKEIERLKAEIISIRGIYTFFLFCLNFSRCP